MPFIKQELGNEEGSLGASVPIWMVEVCTWIWIQTHVSVHVWEHLHL